MDTPSSEGWTCPDNLYFCSQDALVIVVLQHTRFFQGERLSGLRKATKGKVELSAQEITGIFLFKGLTEPLEGTFLLCQRKDLWPSRCRLGTAGGAGSWVPRPHAGWARGACVTACHLLTVPGPAPRFAPWPVLCALQKHQHCDSVASRIQATRVPGWGGNRQQSGSFGSFVFIAHPLYQTPRLTISVIATVVNECLPGTGGYGSLRVFCRT